MVYSVVVLLWGTYENGRQSGKYSLVSMANCFTPHIIRTYSHQGQTFVAINPDAFATGFEERMNTFSQEMRALNPVRIVVMEALAYDVCGRGCLCYA